MACWVVQADRPIVGFGDHRSSGFVRHDGADRRFAGRRRQRAPAPLPGASFRDRRPRSCRPIAFPVRDARRLAMRIVGGKFKGRAIRTPEGSNTRPTSDRARESIFNVLAHAEWAPSLEGARVIDAFAGSGALGFEAMSRGAAFCLFVETESSARGCIRDNIETFQLLIWATRIHASAGGRRLIWGRSLRDWESRSICVFLDPPYAYKPCAARRWTSSCEEPVDHA